MIEYNVLIIVVCATVLAAILMDALFAWIAAGE